MDDILKLAKIQLLMTALFVLGKGVLRPFILERSFPVYWNIIVLSLPNFFEGVIGVITTVMVLLYLKSRLKRSWNYNAIYFFALVFSAIYVITQEFKLHNLGGNNVYDPYDVLFSLIGLGVGYFAVLRIRPVVN